MDSSKIDTQMKKWVLEYIILAIIAKGEVYASDILNVLKESDLLIVEGTLYPLLSRFKTDKLVDYSWMESLQWPPRKYYTLTEKGHSILKIMRSSWEALANVIKNIDK